MDKYKITVWDYRNNMNGWPIRLAPPENFEPIKYEVDAWCVGGPAGIRAYFFVGDMFCTANGDDGHWWLVDRCHKHWVSRIKKVMASVSEE